ncbi:MAG: hypothetical protein GDA36_12720 [Rhodobacteraceae bacterium]|nr:hypothetical protein [Paracoccaceae bacterium]
MEVNRLYYGDCMTIIQEMAGSPGDVALIYLDPPFDSTHNYYYAIYKDETGRPLPGQIGKISGVSA